MTPDMKVFQYFPFDIKAAGGVEKHISFLSEGLRRLGCEVSIGSTPGFDETKSGLIHSHGDKLPPRQLLQRFGFRRWVHTLHGTSIGRGVACKEYFGIRNYLAGAKEALASHCASGIICVSQGVFEQACRYFKMNRDRMAAIIPNGAMPPPSDASTPMPSDLHHQPYILYLGRGDDRVKNTPLLQRAFGKLRRSYPHVNLLVAPGGGFTPADGVVVLGPKTSEEVTGLLRNAAALVLPSLYEADSLVLWEAMALGTPLITSPVAGAKLVDFKYKYYKFIKTDDDEGLCAAMAAYLEAPPERVPLVRTWNAVASETLGFYRRMTVNKG